MKEVVHVHVNIDRNLRRFCVANHEVVADIRERLEFRFEDRFNFRLSRRSVEQHVGRLRLLIRRLDCLQSFEGIPQFLKRFAPDFRTWVLEPLYRVFEESIQCRIARGESDPDDVMSSSTGGVRRTTCPFDSSRKAKPNLTNSAFTSAANSCLPWGPLKSRW